MLTQISYSNLDMIIVILTSISLSSYVFLAYAAYRKPDESNHILFVNNVIAFSILWVIQCIFIVLYFLHKYSTFSASIISTMDLIAAFFIISMLIAAVNFVKNKNVNIAHLIAINIVIIFFISTFILFQIPLNHICNITLSIYSISSICFGLITYKKNKKVTKVGFIYIFLGVSALIIINALTINLGLRVPLVIDSALILLMSVGFFLYYIEIYSTIIKEKIEKISSKNRTLQLAEKKISNLAYINQITKLKNIHKLQEDINDNNCSNVYFIMLNLENFELITNISGINKSNEVLNHISVKLKDLVRNQNDIYHINYDKFIFLYNGDFESCTKLSNDIIDIFENNNFSIVELKPYLGITEMKRNTKNFERIIRELELASQYAPKNNRKYVFYTEEFYNDLETKLKIQNDLKEATINKNWEIFFQPKLSVEKNEVIGAEALIRCKGMPTKLTPDVFIPLAEQLGLIKEIGEYVISSTFKYLNVLSKLNLNDLKISINLSPYQLMNSDFFDFVTSKVKKYAINTKNIIFEITESALIHNIVEVNETIQKLKNIGFSFSLDDFGTGYSSLHYFSKLNFDEVKFDKTFTSSIPHDKKNLIILDSIIKMAKQLNIKLVIEGVETHEQYNCIKELDCDFYQGYLFSKPISFNDFITLINSKQNQAM